MSAVQRTGDASKRADASQTIAEVGFARSTYRQWRSKVDELAAGWEGERQKTDKVRDALERANGLLSQAQEDIDADYLPEGAQPKARIAKRDKLQLEVKYLEAQLEAQRRGTAAAFEELGKAEKKLFEADRDLHQFVDKLESSEAINEIQRELDSDRSARLAKLEVQRARRWESEQKQAIDARATQIQDLTKLAGRQLEATARLNKAAKERVRQTTGQQKEVVKKLEAARETHLADRLEAVLELKANQNAARAEVATQAEKNRLKAKAAQDELEREKASMLAKGLNPYTEFRKKEFAAEAASRERRMKQAVEQNKAQLAERLIKEEEGRRVEEAAELKAKLYEKKHRDEQGRHVVEERVQEYITSVTTGGREVLDPTGRASRVDPSQITDIPDLSFGLGKSQRIPADAMKRITEKIRQKLRVEREDLGEYQHLVKGLMTGAGAGAGAGSVETSTFGATAAVAATTQQAGAQQEEARAAERRLAELKDLAQRAGSMPGVEGAAVTVNLNDDEAARAELLKIAAEEAGGEIALGPPSDERTSRYPPREPSKFESDSLERAKERQRQRLLQGTVQVAGGRTFQGQAFVPKPAEVLYKDFEVGKTYTRVFTLTNASYTFNSFKLLELEDAYVDFFIIKFERPGRMSAGVSCPITVTFTPLVRQDIITSIKFLTETGPVDVPLRCLIKRCAPRVFNPELDFGNMVMGQRATQLLTITNSEALSTALVVSRVEPEDSSSASPRSPRVSPRAEAEAKAAITGAAPEVDLELDEKTDQPAENDAELNARVRRVTTEVFRRKQREDPVPFSFKSYEAEVGGYSSVTLSISCAPLAVGPLEQTFSVLFSEVRDADKTLNDLGQLVTREQRVTVRAKGDKVPIFLDEETVDLRTCLFGRVYRKRLEVRNRAKTAYRVNVKVASMFRGLVEVSPDMAFVQGRSSQILNIKFAPTPELLARIGHFTVLRGEFLDAALVALPIELEVVNQDLPVYFVLRAEVTRSTIELSSRRLDFGQVYAGQSSSLQLSLTNTSMLPQKVAFVRLKREVSVSPNDGFAVLLPNETTTFSVSFSPGSAASFEQDLVLLTSCNDKYVVKLAAVGVEPPVEMSSAVLHFRTTGPGERVLESTMVKNVTNKRQCLEIVVPDSRFTWLKVSPTIIDLAPLQSARIEFEFLPPADAASLDPSVWHQGLTDALEAEPQESKARSPLEEWKQEDGWVYAKGLFGELQWVKEGAGIPPPAPKKQEQEQEQGGDGEGSGDAAFEGASESKEEGEEDAPKDLPREEWGISAKWSLPVFMRPSGKGASSSSALTAPLFLGVHTMVTLPQIEADPKVLDFGQLALGTRVLRTVKLINRSSETLKLAYDGINAVGPFAMIRPPRALAPGEIRTIVVECLPVQPGLAVEVLELKSAVEVGGHQLRIPLKAQGLKPSIELEGLAPAPKTWDPRCGLLDMGAVVPADAATRSFTIVNRSAFAVDVNIARAAGKGLSPAARSALVERTAAGGAVIAFRPERCNIAQGGSATVTVTFDPDRGRFEPFREDLEVVVGQTDEVLRVGVVGRCWARQCYVVPANPADEPFFQVALPGGSGVAPVEDPLRSHPSAEVRQAAKAVADTLRLELPTPPPLRLDFPDPFSPSADPASFVEVGAAAAAAKPPAKGAAAPTAAAGARSQTKKILVGCAKVSDGRLGSGPGTYEVVLSQRAKDSGLWSLGADKGTVNAGQEVPVDVTCTLNKPRGVGGLAVGSWENYEATVVLKGGWGEPQEARVPVVLRCFVSL